jgi:hypothetical protein
MDIRCTGCRCRNSICVVQYNELFIGYCPCMNCIVKSMCMKFCIERLKIYQRMSIDNKGKVYIRGVDK